MRDIVKILPRQILEGLSVVIVVGFVIIAAYSEKISKILLDYYLYTYLLVIEFYRL